MTRDPAAIDALAERRARVLGDESSIHGAKSAKSSQNPSSVEESALNTLNAPPIWPAPLRDEAFHGVAGEIVRAIEPHSEADPVAILAQVLVAAGNVVGRGPRFAVEGTWHRCNEFVLLVGVTGGSRKGSSLAQALRPFAVVAPQWLRENKVSGLSSGEGLLYAVRDPSEATKLAKEKRRVAGQESVVTDPGVEDKRLFVYEPEFSSVLRVMSRLGNTLSPTLRGAWDGEDVLRTLTKNSPVAATDAHVSLVGHITASELRRYLDRTEAGNGFLNRFLVLCAQRSKLLPEGGALSEQVLKPLADRLAAALSWADGAREIRRDDGARELWREEYPRLVTTCPGLLGAVTSRAEAHVLRLSMIYALLDQSDRVRAPHLRAALALWDYAYQSARFVFGDPLGDPVADKLLSGLQNAGADGLSRTDIHDLFERHKTRDQLAQTLGDLQAVGLAVMRKTKSGGRPTERWYAREAR